MRAHAIVLACALAAGSFPAGAFAADRSSIATVTKPAEAGAPWSAADLAAVRTRVDAALANAPGLRGAHVGLLAVDARSGATIYARNPADEFIPASNAKLVTGSAALVRLGPAFRFRTDAVTSGAVVDGELAGPLVIRGGGDVQLDGADLDGLVTALKRAGIVRLRDAPLIDASHFDAQPYPEGWTWDDFPYDYAAIVGAASFDENAVHFTVAPGAAAGAPARVEFPRDFIGAQSEACVPASGIRVVSDVKTSGSKTETNLALERDPAGCIEVTGSIGLGSESQQMDAAVPSPAGFLRDAVLAKLRAAGIAIDHDQAGDGSGAGAAIFGAIPAGTPATVVWTHASEPLSELLADFWYPSDNLIGEVLLKTLGVARSGTPGTTAGGLALESEFLRAAGVDLATVDLHDGSGLSRYNRVSPRALVTLLQYDWHGPFRAMILDSLPVAGVRGTLAHAYIGSPVERRLFAKTGGMLDVTNLSGYLATERHGALTFSFLIGDALGDDAAIAQARTRVLSALISG